MLVKELRERIKDLPGEMNVYNLEGWGLVSIQHTFRGNLIDVEQFLELRFFSEHEHTPQFEDILIERETGFKDRKELIQAYKALKALNKDKEQPNES